MSVFMEWKHDSMWILSGQLAGSVHALGHAQLGQACLEGEGSVLDSPVGVED
jgi:hypothetical protein